jgi:chromosome segregation ATPase
MKSNDLWEVSRELDSQREPEEYRPSEQELQRRAHIAQEYRSKRDAANEIAIKSQNELEESRAAKQRESDINEFMTVHRVSRDHAEQHLQWYRAERTKLQSTMPDYVRNTFGGSY